MNRRTLKGQRKNNITLRKKSKKRNVEKSNNSSCDSPGCGCGN